MSMQTSSSPVASWFQNLPLSDPRCDNDSCIAFYNAHQTSQAQISWASQFLYGHYVSWYYACIIFLFILVKVYHKWMDLKNRIESDHKPSLVDRLTACIRAFTYRRVPGRVAEWLQLPSFGIIFLVGISYAVGLSLALYQHAYYRGNRGYGSPPLAVRTGLMSAACIPLIVALGGKFNLITLMTGIGHEKLNVMHRATGWIMFWLSTIHTIPFFVQENLEHIVHKQFYKVGAYEYTGVPPYAMGFGLVILSLPFVRRWAYETFWFLHLLLYITFLGTCFWHFGNEGDSWTYLYGTLAVWLLQLGVRSFHKVSAFSVGENWLQTVPVAAHAFITEPRMLRLDVLVPDHWYWKPGQHVFLRFPRLNLFDNHPFTIASIPHFQRGQKSTPAHAGTNVMTFLVREHSGVTRKLLSYLNSTPDVHLSCVVDGPYGSQQRKYEHCADEVLLVAGGNGVTAVLPLMLYLSKAIESNSEPALKKIKLVWAVRRAEHIDWIRSELHEALSSAKDGNISLDVYVTDEDESTAKARRQSQTENKEIEITAESDGKASTSSSGQMDGLLATHFRGRPNLAVVVSELVGEGRTAIVGCGPVGFKIDLSNAAARLQSRVFKGQAKKISLHTETFDW